MRKINDFVCNDCGSINEILYDSENIEAVVCPNCQSSKVEKMLGAPAISYQGAKTLTQRTPDGMKSLLKAIRQGTPDHARGKADSL